MPELIEFAKISITLHFTPIGNVSAGFRLDVPFEGVATSSHWEGERPVSGFDRITIGTDGVQNLDIAARIGAGKQTVGYRAIGRGTQDGGPRELLVFETADPDLAWLNTAIGVAVGTLEENQLELTVYTVEP